MSVGIITTENAEVWWCNVITWSVKGTEYRHLGFLNKWTYFYFFLNCIIYTLKALFKIEFKLCVQFVKCIKVFFLIRLMLYLFDCVEGICLRIVLSWKLVIPLTWYTMYTCNSWHNGIYWIYRAMKPSKTSRVCCWTKLVYQSKCMQLKGVLYVNS